MLAKFKLVNLFSPYWPNKLSSSPKGVIGNFPFLIVKLVKLFSFVNKSLAIVSVFFKFKNFSLFVSDFQVPL